MSARRTHLVLAVVVAAASVIVPATLDGASRQWREIRDDGFVLRSTVRSERFSSVACELERVAQTLRPVYQAANTAPASIMAVDTERDLRELLPQFWEHRGARPLGGFWSGAFGSHLVIRVDVSETERGRRMRHEYAHFLTHVTYGDPPPWLDEGLSELWTYATSGPGEVVLGQPVAAHLKLLKNGDDWIPVQALVGAGTLPDPAKPAHVARFYAESWALTHYLVVHRRTPMARVRAVSAESLPSDDELFRYIRQSPLPVVTLAIGAVGKGSCGRLIEGRPMAPVEALSIKAQALADGTRPAQALPLLAEALAMAPDDPTVIETLAVVRFLTSDTAAAAATFDRLIAAGGASHLSYYYRALLPDTPRPDGSLISAADYLQQALRLAPDFTPARARLAERRP